MSKISSTQTLLKQLDFGTLLGDQATAERLLRGLLRFAHSEQNRGTASEIYKEIPSEVSKTLLEDALGYMEASGWIEASFSSGEIRYEIRADDVIEPMVGARQMLELSRELADRRTPEEFELVCTLPDADPQFSNYHPIDFGLNQITSRLLELCGEASRRIILFSPFIESEGIEWLVPGLRAAIQRGISVYFISGDLADGSPNSHALDSLIATDRGQNPGSLRIFDYYEPSDAEESYPKYTLHAKLLLVDRERAYMGSANFTENAFTRYLETGVILEGDQVGGLTDLAEHVLSESAQQIYPP